MHQDSVVSGSSVFLKLIISKLIWYLDNTTPITHGGPDGFMTSRCGCVCGGGGRRRRRCSGERCWCVHTTASHAQARSSSRFFLRILEGRVHTNLKQRSKIDKKILKITVNEILNMEHPLRSWRDSSGGRGGDRAGQSESPSRWR